MCLGDAPSDAVPLETSEERGKGQKRKVDEAGLETPSEQRACASIESYTTVDEEIKGLIAELVQFANTDFVNTDQTPEQANALAQLHKKAAHSLSELAKHEENVPIFFSEGAVEPLVKLLAPRPERSVLAPDLHEDFQKEAALTLGLLANTVHNQKLLELAGVLKPLVNILVSYDVKAKANARIGGGVVRRAADAITSLAHQNGTIKNRVRAENAIPPLVTLLDASDAKVQRAAAAALRTLAFKSEENKKQIVGCNALPKLIFMLQAEDMGIHYEAVGVIGNLVHSSAQIKKRVLDEGALQPVIGLLSSRCTESQREAALLIGQFATTDPDYKIRIVQRGAVGPLISMLSNSDSQLREMAAFALGRLAQNGDNQAGIVHAGGLRPLLDILDAKNGALQHNAAFALYGLADNEDNIGDIVKEGGVERLMGDELIVQASKDCAVKTLKRIEEKMASPRVLRQLQYLLRSSRPVVQERCAVALAHLCRDSDLNSVFIQYDGLMILLNMVCSTREAVQREGARALVALAKKACHSLEDTTPPPPTPQVYLGEQYVNSQTLSDVTFVVEGKTFHAHRIALLASSDAFRAMFDGGYKEKEAQDVEIPNISWKVFESMMRFIYTGTVEVENDTAQDLLRAADQYLLEGLKKLCEYTIAKGLAANNVIDLFELADALHAPNLRHACILYTLEHRQEIVTDLGVTEFYDIMERMRDTTAVYFEKMMTNPLAEGTEVPKGK